MCVFCTQKVELSRWSLRFRLRASQGRNYGAKMSIALPIVSIFVSSSKTPRYFWLSWRNRKLQVYWFEIKINHFSCCLLIKPPLKLVSPRLNIRSDYGPGGASYRVSYRNRHATRIREYCIYTTWRVFTNCRRRSPVKVARETVEIGPCAEIVLGVKSFYELRRKGEKKKSLPTVFSQSIFAPSSDCGRAPTGRSGGSVFYFCPKAPARQANVGGG